MKKAAFYSLSIALFLMLLFVIVAAQNRIADQERERQIEQSKQLVLDSFVDDFTDYYIAQILDNAAKQALVEESKSGAMSFDELKTTMENDNRGNPDTDSINTQDLFEGSLGLLTRTLPEDIQRQFDFSVQRVEQLTFDSFLIVFDVEYEFRDQGSIWTGSVEHESVIEANGITHPGHTLIIDDVWVEDSASLCLADWLFTNPVDCNGNEGIIDPSLLGP